jgi:hypothetical protein
MSQQLPDELIDLLVSDVTEGLEPDRRDDLDALLREHPDADPTSWERVAALTHLALLDSTPGAVEAMPETVRRRLTGDLASAGSNDAVPSGGNVVSLRDRKGGGFTRDLGWYLAAGIAVAWVGTQWFSGTLDLPGAGDMQPQVAEQTPLPAPEPTLQQRRTELLAAGDALTVPWTKTVDEYSQVSGDVVWSNERQEGYMRLVSMPPNDAARAQYQLWIVDPERDQEPVDGGVFDVASNAEVIVPIEAKLEVVSPAAFAITREKPGGVVVSEGPLLVVASL